MATKVPSRQTDFMLDPLPPVQSPVGCKASNMAMSQLRPTVPSTSSEDDILDQWADCLNILPRSTAPHVLKKSQLQQDSKVPASLDCLQSCRHENVLGAEWRKQGRGETTGASRSDVCQCDASDFPPNERFFLCEKCGRMCEWEFR